jgi:RNA polymerase sigma factor (sigma-70 family)
LPVAAESARFEELILPHLDAVYNLAGWLVRNGTDAEGLVQEAYLRAWKGFSGFRGADGRSWLLTIVRNACYTWLHANRRQDLAVEFDEDIHSKDSTRLDAERLVAESSGRQALVWPSTESESAQPTSQTREGYNVIHWSHAGMTFWAVSDLATDELQSFVAQLRK